MMAAVMTFGMAVTANAKEITGSGTVSYDGSNTLKTTFSTEELNTQISKVTPGDTLTLNIAIQNDGKNHHKSNDGCQNAIVNFPMCLFHLLFPPCLFSVLGC